MKLAAEFRQQLLTYQRFEITRHHIYRRLASMIRAPENRQVLEKIAQDELRHYRNWRLYTGQDVQPDTLTTWKYHLISRVFGFPFSLKLMELGEEKAQSNYAGLRRAIPEIETWIRDEETHEQALMEMLDEDRLHYDGSVVLGLNEVLVALCGVLAILTLALQNTKMIALSGWITGIAAAIAMAVSEFMFRRSEKSCRHPLRAATQVGLMYVLMVTFLVSPYWLFENIYLDLGLALGIALSIIAICYAYISVAKDEPFRRGFFEMAGLSLGLAGVLFPLGYLIRVCLGIEP